MHAISMGDWSDWRQYDTDCRIRYRDIADVAAHEIDALLLVSSFVRDRACQTVRFLHPTIKCTRLANAVVNNDSRSVEALLRRGASQRNVVSVMLWRLTSTYCLFTGTPLDIARSEYRRAIWENPAPPGLRFSPDLEVACCRHVVRLLSFAAIRRALRVATLTLVFSRHLNRVFAEVSARPGHSAYLACLRSFARHQGCGCDSP